MPDDYITYFQRQDRLQALPQLQGVDHHWENGQQSPQAEFVARAIHEYDERNGSMFDLEFGGDGDDGEHLIYLLDMLIEAGVIIVPDHWIRPNG